MRNPNSSGKRCGGSPAAAAWMRSVRPMTKVSTVFCCEKGWPRPLLAWLTLQQQRALAAGDRAEADRLQRRIDAVAPGR